MGIGYSVIVPLLILILPILFPVDSVNQILPSGPAVMPFGELLFVGIEYSVIVPSREICPILFPGI